MANPFDQFDTHQPVYGAAPPPTQPLELAGKQLSNTRTQQEIDAANATAAANTTKANAEAKSASIDAQTKQEAYDAAHPKGTGATVIGPDSLKSLSVPDQELVKALADGRLAFPAGFALKAPWWQQKLEQVAQFDPTFDATNYNNRAKARATIVTGKVGGSANALNTAIGHLGLLSSQLDGTASHGPWDIAGIPIPGATAVNAVENAALRSSGQSGITNFQDTASKLADELESVYRNGGGAEQGVVRQLRNLDPNMSGEQKQGIVANALELLSSKQAANLYQYNIGSGGKPPVDLLDPQAHAVLDKFPGIRNKYFALPAQGLSGQAAALLQANGGTPPGASPPPAPPNQVPPSPTDPTETTAGAFADQTPYSPAGAQAFHDAFYSAMAGKQLKSVGDVQNWVAQYNKQHNSDWGLDYTNTPKVIAAALSGKQFGVQVPTMTQSEQARLTQRIATNKTDNPQAAATAAGVADTALLGAPSSIAAVADATGGLLSGKGFDYTGNLNADSAYLNEVRREHPRYYLGGQLAGGFALPTGGARTVPEFAKLGAAYGGAYGFNESAGQPLADRAMNALYGAGTGAAVPYALKGAGRVIPGVKAGVNKLLDFLPQKATSDLPINPDQLAAAGQAEGVPVNRMMVDPALETKATAVGKTMIGAPRLRAGMNDVGSKIEGRVQDLGQGGNALEPQTAGNTVMAVGKRYIADTGAQFNRLYGSLQKATQGLKITPAQALLDTEQMIGKLSETPNQNANEINYLQGLKSDLSKGLSIDALRGMRTKLRQNIANGNLTFGADEGRVLSIMDAASQDIGNGLRAAGKGAIADRYAQVDAAYRDRMNMIQGTVQKLIGKRGQNVSGEQVYANLKAMAGPRGDASGLTRMMDQMTPEERNDTAATFADALGKNQAGDFSTAFLAKRVNAMPQAMRVAVFGQDGAQSLNNLGMLAKAHARVAAKLGGSPTGLANDYRGWLTDLVLGGVAGAVTESGPKGMAVAAAGAGVKATRDIMNSRMLLNTDIQKWLRSAPATTSQKAIDVHFARLNSIAARNPGLAQDIVRLKQSILSAANSNSPISGAVAASPDQGPQQQAQSQ